MWWIRRVMYASVMIPLLQWLIAMLCNFRIASTASIPLLTLELSSSTMVVPAVVVSTTLVWVTVVRVVFNSTTVVPITTVIRTLLMVLRLVSRDRSHRYYPTYAAISWWHI